jgi:hypothetical protein
MLGAWKAWLSSLATDAEAATAAAHMYAGMPPETRDALLDALEEDAPTLEVPGMAVYGPLLAVESDPDRKARIRARTGGALQPITEIKRALLATGADGVRVAALVIPLYLDFVRLLVCRFVKDQGFDWVRQDPFLLVSEAPVRGTRVDGLELLPSSSENVVDELAHAVLAHRRSGRDMPRLLRECSDLFSPQPCVG